jgi:hypothetical protein
MSRAESEQGRGRGLHPRGGGEGGVDVHSAREVVVRCWQGHRCGGQSEEK